MRKPITVLAVGATALALLLAGCGGGDNPNKVASLSSNNPTTSAAPAPGGGNAGDAQKEHDALVAYAQCMRSKGIDYPDPKPGEDGTLGIKQGDTKMEAAAQACASKLPNGGQSSVDPAQEHDKMVKYAECMRAKGIDIPDPKPGEALGMPNVTDQQKFEAAEKACGSIMAG